MKHTIGIAFSIPQTRLVCIEYIGRGIESKTLKSCIVAKPSGNAGLQSVMLKRGASLSQVRNVKAVEEHGKQS